MKMIKKLKTKLAVKRYDFHPEISDGPIDRIENALFYCVDGIGDVVVASPIIAAIMEKCRRKAFFVCSNVSRLYIDQLSKKYKNIVIIPVENKAEINSHVIEQIAQQVKKEGGIDIAINGLGRISPLFAQLAHLLKPRAVLSVMESAKRSSRPNMVHRSAYYANMLYRRGISLVDCWGIVAQMIGGHYDRTLLFPVGDTAPQLTPYIAISLSGASLGKLSENNAIRICQMVAHYYKGHICLIASPGIESLCHSVAAQCSNVSVSPLPASLELTGIYIKHAQALVSVCSAPVHIAGAFNTPVFVIRGVVQPEWRPVVSHFAEYITPQKNINSLNPVAFEQQLKLFISGLDI